MSTVEQVSLRLEYNNEGELVDATTQDPATEAQARMWQVLEASIDQRSLVSQPGQEVDFIGIDSLWVK